METKQNKSFSFAQGLTEALEKLTPDQFTETNALLNTQNDRQKLKSIKKVLESNSESNLINILTSFIGPLVIKEYIYGNLESKPTVLNIFKVLDISSETLTKSIFSLENFDEVKKVVEIIEMLCLSNRFSEESKLSIIQEGLISRMYNILFVEYQDGALSVVKNEFRTKWLESFVEILRCVNYVVRFVGQNNEIFKEQNKKIEKITEDCVSCCQLLTKEVITQLFLLLVYLKPELPFPESPLQQIHYLHASTIVKGKITLKPLLKLASELKDTEHKSQLSPILLKSFQEYFQLNKNDKKNHTTFDEELKQNAFDSAVSLFDVGRSIYSYLEEIIDIIITKGGIWSLEGNFARKFFIAKVALKHVPTKTILEYWPSCLEDCFAESGNMTMPYVSDCAEAFLSKLYIELNKDYAEWMNVWIETYKKLLVSENRTFIRGITEFINPILLKINSSNSLLLRDISSMPKEDLSTQLGVISLIKCYKDIGKIESKHNVWLEQQQKIKEAEKAKLKSKTNEDQQNKKAQNEPIIVENDETGVFIHLDDPQFEFGSDFLLNLLLSNDPMTSLQTFEFLIASRKPSQLIHPQEMKLISEFFKNCLKTSMPEYRKSYLNLTRRMLERCRKNYEKDILLSKEEATNLKQKPTKKQTPYYQEFIQFLNQLINLCFFNIYPDSIFEITNPALEILLLILNMFGPLGCEIRKGTFIEPCNLLEEKTNFFDITNFENLVVCLQSSYESIRSIAHQIINNFVNFNEDGVKTLRKIWKNALANTNKLSIKSYEFACRMLTFISQVKINNKNIIEEIPLKYSFNELNTCSYLLNLLRERYEIFIHQFTEQNETYYQNLIHGILTCFSYILDQISQKNDLSPQNLADMKLFLEEFFTEIIKILNFSVEISSANNITVVLDTISTASQTDKKMTVDCRGHFLPEKKVQTGALVGNYLDSTALITSMENEDEGIENTLVVSFYLLTREAGLVFQSIGSLMGNKKIAGEVPKKELIELVNTYFYALINLKHMGSVDRISNGLSKMAKVIFDQEDKELLKIPEDLLLKLLQLLSDGKFTNILRRSAGVPYAFTCLLKSEAIKRKVLIEKTIKCLLQLSKECSSTPIELRIHSLNILKKLFQDSDLKQELDVYVSEAFISSITGFTNEEWGVRNSSLMLFSVLANRTVGIKPTYNLLEFFHKCPGLLDFITQELSLKRTESMYPPLYPIVLLLSRLLPFDLKEKARMSLKGITNKQVRKEELLSLLPLLRKAGDNHNYMGRVMTAKAILPFMNLLDIAPYCVELTETYVRNANQSNFNNNGEHYRLTECYQLLTSYHEIIRSQEGANHIFTLGGDIGERLRKVLQSNAYLLSWTKESNISPTVQEIFTRIYHEFIQVYFLAQSNSNHELLLEVSKHLEKLFNTLIEGTNNCGDLGHSLMYKSVIELLATCYKFFKLNTIPTESKGELFIKYLQNQSGQTSTDYEMLSLVLLKTTQLVNEREAESTLVSQLKVWLNEIDLVTIESDEVVIQILNLMAVSGQTSDEQILEILKVVKNIESSSENKHMKVAIFDYLLSVLSSPKHLQQETVSEVEFFLKSLLSSYSNPSQLEDLRECCILYLEQSMTLESDLLIVYLRVLEDEEYEIRRRAAFHICRIMGTACRNEVVTARELINRFLSGQGYIKATNENVAPVKQMTHQQKTSFLKELLEQNSDYQIREKNHSEERIFSYDKPNKYRTDINMLFEVGQLLSSSVIAEAGIELKLKELEAELENYREEIMSRDEYVFEYFVRGILGIIGQEEKDKAAYEQTLKDMEKLHPILQGLSIRNLKE